VHQTYLQRTDFSAIFTTLLESAADFFYIVSCDKL